MSFNIGDVVYLKSGGPAMTINQIYKERENVQCVWFVQNEQKECIFKLQTLTSINPLLKPSPQVVPTKNFY
ncbi:DUF2158 domain-containing protein [Acinetobacter pittii]|uniref:YodC family protein n=1 Tax=Acinetobacter pittii TaxID=48296 RepID=UPI0021CD5B16|nr:DUF2158 domain-containing protein [Acinetobacter pittii]MCU4431893.1 DUF2158 domain-containing protein [Acinetobacter pittii]MCU4534612.1 DUF2158 domain-containing protein [Acinetobacter pittii]